MNPTQVTEYIKNKYNLQEDTSRPHVLIGSNREDLYKLFAQLGYKVGCEIGLEKGKNAQTMFEIIPNLKLYCIDPYKHHPRYSYAAARYVHTWNEDYLAGIKNQAYKRMRDRNAVIIEKFSEDAIKDVADNSLDFVYIDGDHSYDFVMLDIILWGRKVKKGGIVSGHDYYYDSDKEGRHAKVTQAINDYTNVHHIEFYITNEGPYVKKGDTPPSWFWVKMDDIWPNVIRT